MLGSYKAELLLQAQLLDGISEYASLIDPEMLPLMNAMDREQLFVDAVSLLDTVIADFMDVEVGSAISPTGRDVRLANMAAFARSRISQEYGTLGVGGMAPATEGQTVLGEDLRLTDYRGRIVVLTFWSTSCRPCMQMIPQEKALVERYRDKPFALLGVNTDQDRQTAVTTVTDHQIDWPNWWDAPRDGGSGMISQQWNIRFQPTVYVLDHKGVIRHKHLRGDRLVTAIDSLLQELSPPQ
jgi:peroxiredoxin